MGSFLSINGQFRFAFHGEELEVQYLQKKYHVYFKDFSPRQLEPLKEYDWRQIAQLIPDLAEQQNEPEETILISSSDEKTADIFQEIANRISLKTVHFIDHIEKEMEQFRKELSFKQREIDDLQRLSRASKRIGVMEKQVKPETTENRWKERIEQFEEKRDIKKQEIENLFELLEDLEKEYETFLNEALEISFLKKEKENFQVLYRKAKQKSQTYLNRLQALRKKEEKIDQMEKEFQTLSKEFYNLKELAKQRGSKNRDLTNKMNQLEEKNKELTESLTHKQEETKQLNSTISQLKKKNKNLEDALLQSNQLIEELQEDLSRKRKPKE